MPEKTPDNKTESKLPEELMPSQNDAANMENEEAFNKWLFENGEEPEYITNGGDKEKAFNEWLEQLGNPAGTETEPDSLESPQTKEAIKKASEQTGKRNPFESHWDKGVKSLKDKYLGVELDPEAKEDAENLIEKEEEEAKLDFVKKWIKDNKGSLEKEHPVTKGMDEEKLITFVLTEMGPGKDPFALLENDKKTQKKYMPDFEKMANLHVVYEGIKKDPINLEAQFLALNHFYKMAKKTSQELSRMQEDPNSTEDDIKRKKEEWFKESKIVKELTEKFTGQNPKELAEEKVSASSEKEKKEFVDLQFKRLEEIKSRRHNQILQGLSERDLENAIAGTPIIKKEGGKATIDTAKDFRLQSKVGELTKDQVLAIVGTYGIEELRKIRHKDIFSNKILIGGQEIESENLGAFLAQKKKELDDKLNKEFEEAVEFQWKKKTRKDVEKKFDEIIKDVASPKGAEPLIRARYADVKQKMYEQWQAENKPAATGATGAETEGKEKGETEAKEKKLDDKESKKGQDSMLKLFALSKASPEEACAYLKEHAEDISDALKSNISLEVDEKTLLKYAENPKKLKRFLKGCLLIMANAA